MADKPVFLTAEGKAKLEAELQHLITVRRPEVAQRIRAAKEGGDVTDNADYDDAKMEQAFVEGRILTIETMLKNVTMIDPSNNGSAGHIRLGSRVTVVDDDEFKETYLIVGSAEARPAEGKISNESPLGKSLIGKRAGDEVTVAAPSGILRFRILEVA
jgi:transcription elongation factor GreA